MLTYPSWPSRQLVSAAELNPYVYENNSRLVTPSAFRAKGLESTDEFTSRVELKWDLWDFERQGWTSADMKRFRCPASGTYFLSANLTFRPPATMDGKKTAMVDALVCSSGRDGSGSTPLLKSLNNTKIIGSYLSVSTSGLAHLAEGDLLYATAAGYGGTWTKATSENKSWSMNAFSAIQIAPDSKGLGE
ncbi:hypothetical protein [Streptomyces sp. NPDC050485]|uniref:hypothetical protein n=1 Tax=Streptomyces sp. NPDC050485 TaxID=3365617 RepID=UPI0037B17FB3